MAVFEANGKKWTLALTIGKARKAIKEQLEIDFLDGKIEGICNRLITEPTTVLDLLFLLVSDEVDQDSFEEMLSADDNYAAAQEALNSEIENFIQRLRPGTLELWQATTQLMKCQITEAVQRATTLIQSPRIQEAISSKNADAEKNLLELIEKEFSNTPESLDSESQTLTK